MGRAIKISDKAYKQIEKMPGDSFREKVDTLLSIKNRAISREEVKQLIDKKTIDEEDIEAIVEQRINEVSGY